MLIRIKPTLENEADGETTGGAGAAGTVEQSSQQSSEQKPTPGDGAATGTPAADSSSSSSGAAAGETATKDDKPKSALDAVLRVMAKPAAVPAVGDKAAASTTTEEVDEKEHKAAGEGEKEWISKEVYGKLPQEVRRRLGRLTEERNTARDELKGVAPKAQTFDDLNGYCKSKGISQEDFTWGLQFLTLVKSDPAKAYEELQPLLQQLQAHVGEILPADLKNEVAEGTITEARAKELAAARRKAQLLEHRSTEQSQQQREEQAQRDTASANQKVTDAITAWEGEWKKSDPDYPKKSQRVWECMQTLLLAEQQAGKRITPERAVEIGKAAKEDVEKWVKDLMPAPREVRKGPNSGPSGNVVGQPKSALEAARMALAATAG